MLLTYKNEITILYSGECHNTYFEIKRSGGNDEQNKQNKEKRGLSRSPLRSNVQSSRIFVHGFEVYLVCFRKKRMGS